MQLDDLHQGSFGALEKGVGYTTLLIVTVPVLLIPLLHALVRKSILRLTALLFVFLVVLFLVFRFRFSWIVWLDNRLSPFYGA